MCMYVCMKQVGVTEQMSRSGTWCSGLHTCYQSRLARVPHDPRPPSMTQVLAAPKPPATRAAVPRI